jgi:hypothetical protein
MERLNQSRFEAPPSTKTVLSAGEPGEIFSNMSKFYPARTPNVSRKFGSILLSLSRLKNQKIEEYN